MTTHSNTITITASVDIPPAVCPMCSKRAYFKTATRWFMKPMRGLKCGTCGYWFNFEDVPKGDW